MDCIVSLLVNPIITGIVSGVISSIAVWYFTSKYSPIKVKFSENIIISKEGRVRIKYVNKCRRRDLNDARLTAKIVVKGLHRKSPDVETH